MSTAPASVCIGCCAQWPKPCTYHEGWADGFDAAEQRIAEQDRQIATLTRIAEVVRNLGEGRGQYSGLPHIIVDLPTMTPLRVWLDAALNASTADTEAKS